MINSQPKNQVNKPSRFQKSRSIFPFQTVSRALQFFNDKEESREAWLELYANQTSRLYCLFLKL